jgi:hypothetical protein
MSSARHISVYGTWRIPLSVYPPQAPGIWPHAKGYPISAPGGLLCALSCGPPQRQALPRPPWSSRPSHSRPFFSRPDRWWPLLSGGYHAEPFRTGHPDHVRGQLQFAERRRECHFRDPDRHHAGAERAHPGAGQHAHQRIRHHGGPAATIKPGTYQPDIDCSPRRHGQRLVHREGGARCRPRHRRRHHRDGVRRGRVPEDGLPSLGVYG